jgi:hypothetical protein
VKSSVREEGFTQRRKGAKKGASNMTRSKTRFLFVAGLFVAALVKIRGRTYHLASPAGALTPVSPRAPLRPETHSRVKRHARKPTPTPLKERPNLRLLKLTATFALAAVCAVAATNATGGARAASFPSAAPADKTYHHEEGGIQFDLPDGWKAEPDGEMLTVSSPDDAFNMFFLVTEGDTLKEAAEALDEELAKIVKNPKFSGEPKEDEHNGMPHFSQSGTGEIEGVEVELSVDILLAKKPVLILTSAAAGQYEKHVAAAAKLINSIKRMS